MAHGVPFEHVLEADDAGGPQLVGAAVAAAHRHPAVEHEVQRVGGVALLRNDASGLVAHLAAEARHAEEFVHRDEVEEADAA